MNRLNRQRARDAIRLAAAIRGCTCRRDIVHEPRRALIRNIEARHDDDCPAADTRPQLILISRAHR